MAVDRALQGMGAGFTVPSALTMLTTAYTVGRERDFAPACLEALALLALLLEFCWEVSLAPTSVSAHTYFIVDSTKSNEHNI